jgi:hypothetical protein
LNDLFLHELHRLVLLDRHHLLRDRRRGLLTAAPRPSRCVVVLRVSEEAGAMACVRLLRGVVPRPWCDVKVEVFLRSGGRIARRRRISSHLSRPKRDTDGTGTWHMFSNQPSRRWTSFTSTDTSLR